MRDGRVVERGSYPDLVAKQGDFANFVLQHINDANDEEGEEGERGEKHKELGEKKEDFFSVTKRRREKAKN